MPWISETFKHDYLDNATTRNAILRYNYQDLFILRTGFGVNYSGAKPSFQSKNGIGRQLTEWLEWCLQLKKNSEGKRTLFNIAYAQYAKFDFDYTKILRFDERNSLALHGGLGIAIPYGNSTVLPFEKRYFSGGAKLSSRLERKRVGTG